MIYETHQRRVQVQRRHRLAYFSGYTLKQLMLNAPKQGQKPRGLKCNPLKNAKAMERVNPYAAVKKELEAKKQKVAEKAKKDLTALKKAGKNKPAKKDPKRAALKKSFYNSMIAD